MADQKLARTLTLWDGVALAVGSIAGSGILYLPSLTYVLASHDVLLVWLAGTLICLPLRIVPHTPGLRARRFGQSRSHPAVLIVQPPEEHRQRSAQVRVNDLDTRVTRRNAFEDELRGGNGIFDGSADGPGQPVVGNQR